MALAEVFEAVAGPDAPVEFAAYDGSYAGTPGSAVKITVRSPVAVAYLAQAPGALGLARAYVAGHLDVEGDMYETLSKMTKAQSISLGLAERLRLLQALGGPKLLTHRMPPPPQEVRVSRRWLGGRRHSKGRDDHGPRRSRARRCWPPVDDMQVSVMGDTSALQHAGTGQAALHGLLDRLRGARTRGHRPSPGTGGNDVRHEVARLTDFRKAWTIATAKVARQACMTITKADLAARTANARATDQASQASSLALPSVHVVEAT
jgi:hypothetical protein